MALAAFQSEAFRNDEGELEWGMNCAVGFLLQSSAKRLRMTGPRRSLEGRLYKMNLPPNANKDGLRFQSEKLDPSIQEEDKERVQTLVFYVLPDIAALMRCYLLMCSAEGDAKRKYLDEFHQVLKKTLLDYADHAKDNFGRTAVVCIDMFLERVRPTMMGAEEQIGLLHLFRCAVQELFDQDCKSFALEKEGDGERPMKKRKEAGLCSGGSAKQPTAVQDLFGGPALSDAEMDNIAFHICNAYFISEWNTPWFKKTGTRQDYVWKVEVTVERGTLRRMYRNEISEDSKWLKKHGAFFEKLSNERGAYDELVTLRATLPFVEEEHKWVALPPGRKGEWPGTQGYVLRRKDKKAVWGIESVTGHTRSDEDED